MSTINDGGPAFPCSPEQSLRMHGSSGPGMTLRDYFAAKVLPSVYTEYVRQANIEGFDEHWETGVALDAYRIADAMIAARGK